MRKILKLFLLVISVLSFAVQSVVAAEFVTIYGDTDSDVLGFTILALRQNADLKRIKAEDILYIDQSEIDENGRFAITLPWIEDKYNIYSNMDFTMYNGGEKANVYVSPITGNDKNNGATAETAFKTLSAACSQAFRVDEIILLDDTDYEEPLAHYGNLTIKGNTPDVKLNLTSEISLNGDLTLDNLTLNNASTVYANGYKLKIAETVASTATLSEGRLTVYGGRKAAELVGDTDLTLLGAKYQAVYGGGNGGAVKGNTNVVLGGKANLADGINDQENSTISPCYVYGGGNDAAVTGKTNVTIEGEAVSKYLVGAGNGTRGTAVDTNIFINGGKVMNVYGGSLNAPLANCDTHITMTDGLAEALFGGCQSQPLTGNAYITLIGGDVSRRVYTGCYNNMDIGVSDVLFGGSGTWDSDCYVTGTTTLAIYPQIKLNTKTELASDNSVNVGVFSGSRTKTQHDSEINTVIYVNDSYSSHNSYLGEKSSKYGFSLKSWLKSFEDYIVKSSEHGRVLGTNMGGTVKIVPDVGYIGTVNGTTYEKKGEAILTTAETTVTFSAMPYNINSMAATKEESMVEGIIDIMGSAIEMEPTLWIVVLEAETNKLVDCSSQDATTSGNKTFRLNCKFEEGKKYIVKAMLWNGSFKPLSMYYSIELR